MADKTPREIIAEAWFTDNFGGTSDPTITDMMESLALGNAAKAIAALEAAGYRIVPLEPTGDMIQAMYASARRRRGHKSHDLAAALSAAPTWGTP